MKLTGDYYHTKSSVDEYIRLAKDVDGAEQIEKLKTLLAPRSLILEIGSGPGTDWDILSKDYEVVGSDNSKQFLNHLRKTYPSGLFLELDAVTLDVDENYDGIFSNKVLHHLKDDELISSISRQQALLNDGGIICHTFWRGKGSEIFKGLFVNYHTEESLRSFFEPQFEILLLESYGEFEADDSLLIIGRKY